MEIKQSANAGERVTLDQGLIGETLAVLRVQAPELASEWGRWLEEIGFIPGEQVRLIARAMPGGDPLAIRVGQSTFALRCAEAAYIEVEREPAAASKPLVEEKPVRELAARGKQS